MTGLFTVKWMRAESHSNSEVETGVYCCLWTLHPGNINPACGEGQVQTWGTHGHTHTHVHRVKRNRGDSFGHFQNRDPQLEVIRTRVHFTQNRTDWGWWVHSIVDRHLLVFHQSSREEWTSDIITWTERWWTKVFSCFLLFWTNIIILIFVDQDFVTFPSGLKTFGRTQVHYGDPPSYFTPQQVLALDW